MASSLTNYEQWMGELPNSCHSVPINKLAIPGSHDSFSYYLDVNGPLAPDTEPSIQSLTQLFGSLAKGVIHNWSVTQSLSVSDQLVCGIRYFDIRIATKPGTDDLFFVHKFYGPKIESCLDEISHFLDEHLKEVVILDFNHFYGCDESAHERLTELLMSRFASKMCPVMDISNVTLETLWENGLQLIVFYSDNCELLPVQIDNFQLWPRSEILCKWHNVRDIDKLVSGMTTEADERLHHMNKFHVTQGILTPDVGFIVANLAGSLKNSLSTAAAGPVVDWIRKRETAKDCKVNIVTMDFVEKENFIPAVVQLNHGVTG